MAGKLLFRNKYSEGAIIAHGVVIPKSATAAVNGCTDWYLVTSSNGQVVSEQYMYTTCSCDEQSTIVKINNAINRVNCGGGGGGSAGTGATGNPPSNPSEGQEYSFTDKDGITQMYRAHNGTWQFLGFMLPNVVVYGNIAKYPGLATDSPPENGYRVVGNDGYVYTYLGNYGGWIGTYPNDEAYIGNFVLSAADQKLYPRLTNMLTGLPNFVNNNAEVLAALQQYTKLSASQIDQQLKFGNGPTIKVSTIGTVNGKQAYAIFSSSNPNVITLDKAFVQGLENAKLQSTIDATSFLLCASTLHEYVHYGNYAMDFFPPAGVEQGALFERAGFTTVVTKSNAYEIYINLFSK